MYFNFFINKLFLLIFMFFSYNYSIFANNLFNHKEGIYSEYKKVLYLKNNIKKNATATKNFNFKCIFEIYIFAI